MKIHFVEWNPLNGFDRSRNIKRWIEIAWNNAIEEEFPNLFNVLKRNPSQL